MMTESTMIVQFARVSSFTGLVQIPALLELSSWCWDGGGGAFGDGSCEGFEGSVSGPGSAVHDGYEGGDGGKGKCFGSKGAAGEGSGGVLEGEERRRLLTPPPPHSYRPSPAPPCKIA